MIAADASSIIAYNQGFEGRDIEEIERAIAAQDLTLPPAVLVELLGSPGRDSYQDLLDSAPLMPIMTGYWARARATRMTLRGKGLRARTLDTLIAQCCIDSDTPLIARDTDFRHFERWCGLKLAVPLP